jgi:hypothetical protein
MKLRKNQYRIQSKRTGLIQIIDQQTYETLYRTGNIKRYVVLPPEDIVRVSVKSASEPEQDVEQAPEQEPEMKWLSDEEIDNIEKKNEKKKPKKKSDDESK